MAKASEEPKNKFVMSRIALNTEYLLPREIPSYLLRVQQSCLRIMSYLCIHEIQLVSMTQRHLEVSSRAVVAGRRRLLYLCGGSDGRKPVGTTSRFDPQAGSWEPLPDMRRARVQAAGACGAGRIFLCGGSDGQETLNSVECFNPGMRRWEAAPPMLQARCGASAVLVEGALCVVGGKDEKTYLTSAERFRPKPLEGVFHGRPGANMFFAKSYGDKFRWRVTKHCQGLVLDARDYAHSQCVLRSKPFTLSPTTNVDVVTQGGVGAKASIAGLPVHFEGLSTDDGFLGVAIRDVAADQWLLSKRRSFCGGSTWKKHDSRLLEGTGSEETLTFSPQELGPFAGREVTLDVVDTFHGAWGWICIRRVNVASIEVAGVWEAMPPMKEPRCYAAGGKLPGRLLMCGGLSDPTRCNSSVERFDPLADGGTGRWDYELPMSTARACASSAGMGGFLYVCGGSDGLRELNTVERLSGDFGQWEVVSVMTQIRKFAAAGMVSERLYIFGGFDGKRYLDRSETFDEQGWRWEEMSIYLPGQRAFCTVGAMEGIPF
mmetsp:Transcript_88293/g.230389  ORF Transcript_88293/g.230389 Transcript_88293/m.230389 type:complete len:545 (+) Transcript_88293:85-1719(+)